MHQKRYLNGEIQKDLKEKMVFVGGPRQVGKSTLAAHIDPQGSQFYNFDFPEQRKTALSGAWLSEKPTIVLDEFHKFKRWKSWIKGEYDVNKDKFRFLFTGSARLNVYRKGGDSLMGRYHYYRLHPFSFNEVQNQKPKTETGKELSFKTIQTKGLLEMLLKFGGFPEPWIAQSPTRWRRWHRERLERVVMEDIRDLTLIRDLIRLQNLAELIPERVGSILSTNNLANDLEINHRTCAHWIQTLEELYYCFSIPPYYQQSLLSVRKEKKTYLWDWSIIQDPAAKLENLVASHLLKYCHFLQDTEGWNIELFFLRNSLGHECDFLVTFEKKPWFAVEVKTKREPASSFLHKAKRQLNLTAMYMLSLDAEDDITQNGIRYLSVEKFLTALV